jgi:uncharacterized protein
MSSYHEPAEELTSHARDISRALASLKEEVEAIDWYNQRITTTKNEDLKKILEHNRDEEIEHACMAIEWLRKNMPVWEEKLKEELYKGENNHGSKKISDLEIGKI